MEDHKLSIFLNSQRIIIIIFLYILYVFKNQILLTSFKILFIIINQGKRIFIFDSWIRNALS